MDFVFLLKGLVLGFSVAAPVGPIGLLCINRTINKSFVAGFVSGLGAATADLVYGLIAGLGLTLISDFLIVHTNWIQLAGLLFLFYLGIKMLIRKEKEISFHSAADKGLFKDYISTFFLTITNPITILFFIAVFAGLGLSVSGNGIYSSVQLITGVFIGSAVWWLFLSGITHKLKTRISRNFLRYIDLISGILLLCFAVILLFNLIKGII